MVADPIDGKKYMVPDEKHPLIAATDRYFGTENESYASRSYLNRVLALQMNWDNIDEENMYRSRFQPVMNWVFEELGKHYYDAADAWTELRQWIDENSGYTVNNWER